MRNLKRYLAVLVVVAIMITAVVPAFAAQEYKNEAAAESLNTLGLYKGISETEFNPDLGTKLDRQTGVVMLLRIFGKEAEALEMSDKDVTDALAKFSDAATVADWSKKQVAYAVKNGLVNGLPDGTVAPKAALAGKAYCVMILRQLGFADAKYDEAPATLSEKGGLTEEEATALTEATEIIKDDLVGISFGTLSATDKDDKKVIDNLVEAGVVTEEAVAEVFPAEENPADTTGSAVVVKSAVALSSKYVEVTLDAATTADLVKAAKFTVKDAAAKEVAVKSAELAGYDGDKKTVLVALEADTSAGTLYTISDGTKTANFGGKATETDKPTISKIEATDYNKVKITFNEAVLIDAAKISFTEKYGAKAALEIKETKWSAKDAIELTTGETKSSVLYGAVVEGVKDFAGNTMEKSDSKTFTGTSMPTDNQKVDSAKALEYNKIAVKFTVNVDPATIATAKYTVEEAYGTKTTFKVEAKAAVRADAGDYDATANTDDLKDKLAKKLVVLTITEGTMKASTLYKVTVSGMNTLYGKGMSSDSGADNKTFSGVAKPTDSFGYTSVTATNNVTVEVVMARKLDKATAEEIKNYSIALAYGTKAALEVKKAELDGDDAKKVKLTVAAMTGDLYKLTVSNLKDIYGNSVKTGDDAVKSFSGKLVAAKIDAIDSIVRDTTNPDTQIIVTFNKNVGDSATDVSHYTIDNNVGYPSKAEKIDANKAQVKLTIPKTDDEKTYKLTVKGLENSDGVAMGTDGVSKTFAGRGNATDYPVLESASITDDNTIVLYFNKDVTDGKIKGAGKIWDNNVMNNKIQITPNKTGGVAKLLNNTGYTAVSAYQDINNKNALVVRVDADAAAAIGTPFKAADTTYTTFKVELVNNDDSNTTTKVKVAKYSSDSTTYVEVPVSAKETAKPEIENVQALDNRTIKVYFNEPVANDVSTDDFAAIATGINVTSVAEVPNTNAKEWYLITGADMKDVSYNLVTTGTGISARGLAGLTLKTDDGKATVTKEFAGSSEAKTTVTDVFAKSVDKQVVEVYYPEPMNKNADVQALDNTYADFKGSYTVVKANGDALTTAVNIVDVEYDADKFVAKLYLDKAVGETGSFGLKISTNVKNLTGVKTVAKSSTDNADLVVEVAKSDADNAAPKVESVAVSADRLSMDITMSEDVAFGKAFGEAGAVAIDTDANWINGGSLTANNATFAIKGTAAGYDMTAAEFVKAFKVTATFVGGTAGTVVPGDIDTINGVQRDINGKKLTVYFKKALVRGTDGEVSTEPTGLAVRNKAGTAAKTGSDAVKVSYSAPNSATFDTTAPSVATAVYQAYDAATGVVTINLVFNEEIGTVGAVADYSVAYNGGAVATPTSVALDTTYANIVVVKAVKAPTGGGAYTVTVVTPANVKDLKGNGVDGDFAAADTAVVP